MKKRLLAILLVFTMMFAMNAEILAAEVPEEGLGVEVFDESLKESENDPELFAETSYTPSSLYQSSKYYTALKDITLTGNQAQDIVNVALSQVGYHEGDSISDLGGGNINGSNNYTEYGYWLGTQVKGNTYGHYYAWCDGALCS